MHLNMTIYESPLIKVSEKTIEFQYSTLINMINRGGGYLFILCNVCY